MYTYEQSTGRLYRNGELVGRGYSGREEAKNQPDLDCVRDRGPIPRGTWRIGDPVEREGMAAPVLPLAPVAVELHGRSGFLIHGDSRSAPGTASHGCIILPRAVREAIHQSGDRELTVVPQLQLQRVA